MVSFGNWLSQFAYVNASSVNDTMEDAIEDFFYNGVSPWIKSRGYRWSQDEKYICKKFMYLCYMIDTSEAHIDLKAPPPRHRNYSWDRETFDHFVDTHSFVKFLKEWEHRYEIVGTRFEDLIKEFCYIWVDVVSGTPGKFTQSFFIPDEDDEEEDVNYAPEIQSKKKWDLY